MPVTRPDVQEELVHFFPGINEDPLYLRMVEVGYVLGQGMDNVDFVQGLQRLEAALQRSLESRLRPFGPFSPQPNMDLHRQAARDYWNQRLGGGVEKNQTYSHLLSKELTRVERDEGFSFNVGILTSNKAQLYVSVVSPENFRAQLALGRHWKDPGVPGAHGEFTHRIQWYVLAQSGALGPRGTAVRVFKRCGSEDYVSELDPPVHGADWVDLWQVLCDRDRHNGGNTIAVRADSAQDFRCPEHFGEFLAGQLDPGQYPLLRGFLEARAQKRLNWDPTDYVAKKLFRRTYENLTQDQKYRVLGALGEQEVLSATRWGVGYQQLEPNQRQWVDGMMGRGILRPT